MKNKVLMAITALAFSAYAFAADKVEDQVERTVEKSSSRNPFTKTNTDTVVKKRKKRIRNQSGTYVGEDTVKVKRKRSDDGKKTSVTTEETYTEEQK